MLGAPFNYEPANGSSVAEMREAFQKTDLYKRGDARLVWVNEGDLSLANAPNDLRDRAFSVEAENRALRKVISECAEALQNGAAISPECSIEFMAGLPAEIRACMNNLRDDLRRAEGYREPLDIT